MVCGMASEQDQCYYEILVTTVDIWTSYCTLPNVRNHKITPGHGNLSQGSL